MSNNRKDDKESNRISLQTKPSHAEALFRMISTKHSRSIWAKEIGVVITLQSFYDIPEFQDVDGESAAARRVREDARRMQIEGLTTKFGGELKKAQSAFLTDLNDLLTLELLSEFQEGEEINQLYEDLETGELYRAIKSFVEEKLSDPMKLTVVTSKLNSQRVISNVRGFFVERKNLYESLPANQRPAVREQVSSSIAIAGSKLPSGMQGLMINSTSITSMQRLIDVLDSFTSLNGESGSKGKQGSKGRGNSSNSSNQWKCSCGVFNYPQNAQCRKCRAAKNEAQGLVKDNDLLKGETNSLFTVVQTEISNKISNNHSINNIMKLHNFNRFSLPITLLDSGASINVATIITSDMKPSNADGTWVHGLVAQSIYTTPYYHETLKVDVHYLSTPTNIPFPLILSSGSMIQNGYKFYIDRPGNWVAIKDNVVLVFKHNNNRLLTLCESFHVNDVNHFIQMISMMSSPEPTSFINFPMQPPAVIPSSNPTFNFPNPILVVKPNEELNENSTGSNPHGYFVTPFSLIGAFIPTILEKFKNRFTEKTVNIVDIGAGTDARLGRSVMTHIDTNWRNGQQSTIYALEIDAINAAQITRTYPNIHVKVGNCKDTWVNLPPMTVAICNPNYAKAEEFLHCIGKLNPMISIYIAPSHLPDKTFAKFNLLILQEMKVGPVVFQKDTAGLKLRNPTNFSVSVYVLGRDYTPPLVHPTIWKQDPTKFTKTQLEEMENMLELHKHLNHPHFLVMVDMFQRNTIKCDNFSINACQALHEINKKTAVCLGCAHDIINLGFEETSRVPLPAPGKHIHADIMFVTTTTGEKTATLVAKEVVHGFRYVTNMTSLDKESLETGLKIIQQLAKRNGHTVEAVIFDNQPGIDRAGINIGLEIRSGARNAHSASMVERDIRTIKSKMARVLSVLPFHVPASVIPHLISNIINVLNHTPSKDATFSSATYVGLPPLEVIPFAFGDIGIVKSETTNKNIVDGMAVMYLRSDPVMKDTHYVLNLLTGNVLKRRKFKKLSPDAAQPMYSVINKLAGAKGWIDIETLYPDRISSPPGVAFTEWWLNQQKPTPPPTLTKQQQKEQHPGTEIPVLQQTVDYDALLNEADEGDEDDFDLKKFHMTSLQHPSTFTSIGEAKDSNRGAKDSNRGALTHTSTLDQVFVIQSEPLNDSLVMDECCFGIHVTHPLNKAYKQFPNQTDKIDIAVAEELRQLIQLGTFEFIPHTKLTSEHIGHLVGVQLLVAEKAPNVFKGRLVALGNQTKYTASPTSSPTGTRDTKMTLLNIAAHDHLSLMVIDGKTAYLHAEYPGLAIARIPPFIVRIIQKELPEVKIHVANNGCAYAYIRKALYGLKESGRLFYEYQSKKLIENGFTKAASDPCLFHRREKDGKLSAIHVHVDDSLIASNELDKIEKTYRTIFREMKVQRSDNETPIKHLNTRIIQRKDFSIEVDQEDYITNIATKFHITPSPTFSIRKVQPEAEKADADLYLQKIASFNYIQYRPETLEAFCELSHRQVTPTIHDMEDLDSVLGFLLSERERKLTIKPTSLELFAIVDASMGVINDKNGIAGYIMSLGGSLIKAKAEKINVTALSSHENETIGILYAMKEVIYLRELLAELGIPQNTTTIYTDCEPAMFAIGNGQMGTARTKHYAVKIARIAEEIAANNIRLEHQATEVILADVLTKQTSPKKFRNFQHSLLSADIH